MSVMPHPTVPDPSTVGGRLVAVDGTALPLATASIASQASGGFARTVLSQTFVNDGSVPLDVTYTVPLPADGVVAGYRFTVDGVVTSGEVRPRAEAREHFEAAVAAGHTAALLEEERTSLFTQSLGNVPAGATLVVEVHVDQPLLWRDGSWEWRFPTVVAPRYLGDLPPPLREVVTVDVAETDPGARFSASLTIGDARTGPIASPSHDLDVSDDRVGFAGAALDRDVVVRWPVARAEPGVTVQVASSAADPEATFARVTVVPPVRPVARVAKDLVVLVDVSGSMAGEPLAQARTVLDALVAELGPADQLELLRFSSRVERWRPTPAWMDPATRAEARRWIAGLRAGGATEMYTGISAALTARPREGVQRQILLVTDGFIGDERRIVQRVLQERPSATRLHTLGVGSAVNRTLTETVARAGGGREVIIGPGEPATDAVRVFLASTAQPLIVDLAVEGVPPDGQPFRTPDLYAGQPAALHLRVPATGGTLRLTGRTAAGPWSHPVVIPPRPPAGPQDVPAHWARRRIADLELSRHTHADPTRIDAAITELGVLHQVSTRLTSWVAVSREPTVDGLGPKRQVVQPQAVPQGVSLDGIGLRPAVPSGGGGEAAFGSWLADANVTRVGGRGISGTRGSPRKRKARASALPPAPQRPTRTSRRQTAPTGAPLPKEELDADEGTAHADVVGLEPVPAPKRSLPWWLLLTAPLWGPFWLLWRLVVWLRSRRGA
jgi:Ca-activated chloride channel family protein